MVMCFHFVNQYANSRAVPSMLLDISAGGLSPNGTFWFFTAITAVGGLWAWFFIPETAGRSLEGTDLLFKQKWWQIGRFGKQLANEETAREDEKAALGARMEQVENVEMGRKENV
jgi:hypothetical protein